jgi:hypothetical protein
MFYTNLINPMRIISRSRFLIILWATLVLSSCQDHDDQVPQDVTPEFVWTQNWDGTTLAIADFDSTPLTNANGETLRLSKLVYLISDITFTDAQGVSYTGGDFNLIDAREGLGLNFSPNLLIPEGDYTVSFRFGFDDEDNAGNYPALNSADGGWNVPMMLGGGYHFMRMEGKYMSTLTIPESEVNFQYHTIRAANTSTAPITLQDTSFLVNLGQVTIAENTSIEVKMNVAEWFKNPNTWNLYELYTALMPNFDAQVMMSENGVNGVFTLGDVTN